MAFLASRIETTVGRRGDPEVVPELAGERGRRGESALPGDGRDRPPPVLRKALRGGEHAQSADERPHRLPDHGAEDPVEVVRGEVGHPGEGVKREVPVEMLPDVGEHALDPALVLLSGDLLDLRRTIHLQSVRALAAPGPQPDVPFPRPQVVAILPTRGPAASRAVVAWARGPGVAC